MRDEVYAQLPSCLIQRIRPWVVGNDEGSGGDAGDAGDQFGAASGSFQVAPVAGDGRFGDGDKPGTVFIVASPSDDIRAQAIEVFVTGDLAGVSSLREPFNNGLAVGDHRFFKPPVHKPKISERHTSS